MRLVTVLCLLSLAPAAWAQPLITEGDAPMAAGYRLNTVVQGLERPWGLAFLPGGDMLVTERPGALRIIRHGALLPGEVPGIPAGEVLALRQGGLLDVAAHPDFADNRLVYFTYAHGTEKENHTRLARAVFRDGALADWEVLFTVNKRKAGGQHFGSRLAFLPDGTLLMSVGDGGNPPLKLEGDYIRKQAQKKGSHLGKVLRLTDAGKPAPDNPFVKAEGAAPEVWSMGHRNIQGLVHDPMRETVWATEHGALGGDELNRLSVGANYGWPEVTFSREYVGGKKISPHTAKEGYVDPEVVWMTAIAPCGLALYTGERFPGWTGDLFAGGLQSQDVKRIDLDARGRVVGQEAIRVGERVRDVRTGPDGYIYILTDAENGRLIRVEPSGTSETAP